jgi:hypothetical protein
MINNPNIDDLVFKMSERYKAPGVSYASSSPSELEPYTLFLGAGCSVAAGAPSMSSLAAKVFELVGNDDLYSSFIPPATETSEELLKYFYKLINHMSAGQVHRLLLSFFSNIPVPTFYQQLAVLIKSGYFTKILTTNFDTLLEQACNGAGLQLGYDYEVITLSADETADLDWGSRSTYDGKKMAQIIKLHGDLNQEQLAIDPGRLEKLVQSHHGDVKSELKGDVIMVGYESESRPINESLRKTSYSRRELWWAGMPPPPDIHDWASDVVILSDEVSSPEVFLNQLYLRLLRLPALNRLNQTEQYYSVLNEESTPENVEILKNFDSQEKGLTFNVQDVFSSVASSEDLQAENLRSSIRQAQSVLYSLEQSAPPGDIPINIQNQINYQKAQIISLEDQLRGLPSSRIKIKNLLQQIIDKVKNNNASDDSNFRDTLSYLNSQRKTVNKECNKKSSNQELISAAITGIILVVERLNVTSPEPLVDAQLIEEFAPFMPNILRRGGA